MPGAPLRLFASSLALLLVSCQTAAATVATPPPPEVTVAEVVAKPLYDWEDFTGHLEERERVEVRSRVAGYIASIHFEDGARVTRGQLLFEIDPRPFQVEIERANAELEQAASRLDLAHRRQERGEWLLSEGAIAKEEVERLRADDVSARGAVKAARAALDSARLNRQFSEIRSAIDGRISRALIREGNLVSSANLLTTVVSDGPVYAYFDVDEATYLRISSAGHAPNKQGSACRVLMGLANEAGYPREGRLDFQDNAIDLRTGTLRMRASFADAGGTLIPGLFARVRLVLSEGHESILIDERAISTDLSKKFVFVLDGAETLRYREVVLGGSIDGLRIVKQGLSRGEVVVVNGLQRARAGLKVAAARVPMPAEQAESGGGLRQTTAIAQTETATAETANEH
jgi:multidrug efflux system membrane fusion protein